MSQDLLLRMPLQFEPLRKNRWVLRFPSDIGISEWMLQSASRPSIEQKNTEIEFLNTSTFVVGRYNWSDINVTFRDVIAPSTSQALMEWIRLCSESVTGRQGYAAGYKRDLELEMLDPTCVAVQKWVLKNCWISTSNFGELQYSDDSLATITATIVMDYAILAY
nr:MAG TPA: Baseplate wedge protein [Caudoviricetes sp.]